MRLYKRIAFKFGDSSGTPGKGTSLTDRIAKLLEDFVWTKKGIHFCFWLWVTFIVACYKSSDELCYYLWGDEAIARVLRVRPEHSLWSDQDGSYRVTFEFPSDNSGKMQEAFLVIQEQDVEQYPQDSEFEVEYYSDSTFAWRLKGEANFYWVEFFLWSAGGSAIAVVILTYIGILEQRQIDNRKWWIK